MSLLVGDGANNDFDRWLFSYIRNVNNEREKDEWIQVYPNDWNNKIISQFSLSSYNSGLDNSTLSNNYIEPKLFRI